MPNHYRNGVPGGRFPGHLFHNQGRTYNQRGNNFTRSDTQEVPRRDPMKETHMHKTRLLINRKTRIVLYGGPQANPLIRWKGPTDSSKTIRGHIAWMVVYITTDWKQKHQSFMRHRIQYYHIEKEDIWWIAGNSTNQRQTSWNHRRQSKLLWENWSRVYHWWTYVPISSCKI